jgi:UDP-GlcNAc:undecaprenyl-phosphate GlcNAc-1-phosphate transferase
MITAKLAAFVAPLAFAIALGLGFWVVPRAKKWGFRVGLVDHPDRERKLHDRAIPLIGGIAVFVTTLLTLALVAIFLRGFPFKMVPDPMALVGLLVASLLILILGIIDDRYAIRGRQKLLGQIIAATVLIACGYGFDVISVFGQHFRDEMPIIYILVAYAWILVGINSVNLLDGADGFAATIGILTCAALSVMAFTVGRYADAIICAAMAGALTAFMRYNFPPASAYLGDAGSMLIGLFIAAIALKSNYKQATAYTFLAPIALLAIPMFDTLAAIVRRRLTGRSIYTVDRGHLHHALMGRGFGPRKALLLFFAMCLMTATGGTMALIHKQAEYAVLSIMSVGVFLIVGRVFGFAEYKLISSRSRSVLRSFFTMPRADGSHHASIRLQGERNWDLCWQVLREFAEKYRLLRLTMDLNLPWIQESFHANYSSTERKVKADELWSLELPLVVNHRRIGRIKLQANVYDTEFGEVVAELSDILVSLETYFVKTMGDKIPEPDSQDSASYLQPPEFGASVEADTAKADVG